MYGVVSLSLNFFKCFVKMDEDQQIYNIIMSKKVNMNEENREELDVFENIDCFDVFNIFQVFI